MVHGGLKNTGLSLAVFDTLSPERGIILFFSLITRRAGCVVCWCPSYDIYTLKSLDYPFGDISFAGSINEGMTWAQSSGRIDMS